MPSPAVSIVIPAFGQAAITARCITSLLRNSPDLPFEIIVVDDASEPPLVTLLEANERLVIIRNDHNAGFAASCNAGARAARGRLLLLLNNDTEVLPGWWQPLQAAIEEHADYGIVAPKLIFPDRTIQHCGKVWKDTEVPNGSAQHIYYRFPADAPCVNRSRVYGIVTGAAVLVRRDEFLALGGFDEQYQNGWEDDDLCYAYGSRGLTAYYCAESVVIHHQSQTLNREMRNLEQALPDGSALNQLNDRLRTGRATTEEIKAAEHNLTTMGQLEATMDRLRQQYLRNRGHFFSKWGALVKRDDWRYYQADGFSTDPDLPRYPGHLRQRLGRPFEQDPACGINRADAGQQGLVSIIILTWNQLDYTRQCLYSIQQYTPEAHEIIFVDNGSTDGTVAWLQQQVAGHDKYRLISNVQNLGFAKGCNQGIEAASGYYLLLLNNDVVVTDGWLSGLLECLHASSTVGIVGPMTNNISGMQRARQVDYKCLEELQPFAAAYRRQHRHRRIPQRRIVGFCMLFRRSLVEQIGLLDEQFGTGNFEDDDYCVRAALAGCTNLIAGDVFIHHYGSASFQGNSCNYAEVMQGNTTLFRQKWSKPLQGEQAAAALVVKVLEKAELLFQRQEFDTLIETVLQEGIRCLPDESRWYYALARWLIDGSSYMEAEELLSAYGPGIVDAAGLSLLGYCKAGNGELTSATEYADRALQIEPQMAIAHCLKGLLAVESGTIQEGVQEFQAALAADPGFGEAAARWGQVLWEQGEREQGLELMAQGFMRTPLSAMAREAYYQAICSSEQYDQALELFREALHFYPQSKGVAYLLIDLLLRAGELEEAMTRIEAVLVDYEVNDGLLSAGLAVRQQLGPHRPKAGEGPSVSLCMIVKDEERHLARCLHSLKPMVHEVIIVDTGSTDRTRELAEIFGARLSEQPWNGDFAAARNAALEQANGEWILVMDADEVIAPQDHERFRTLLLRDAAPCGYIMETRNYRNSVSVEGWRANDGSYPMQEQGSGWVPSSKIRLFPNRPEIRFEKPVHELVDYSIERLQLPMRTLDIPIHHYGYLDTDKQRCKQEQYYHLGCEKLRQEGNADLKSLAELAVQAAELQQYQQAIGLWEQALAIDADCVLAWFNLGYCHLQSGAIARSLEYSRTALALAPDHRETAVNAAIAAFCLGDDALATQVLQPFAADANPAAALISACLLICSGNMQRYDEGIIALKELQAQGIVLDPFLNGVLEKLQQAGSNARAAELKTALQQHGVLETGDQGCGGPSGDSPV